MTVGSDVIQALVRRDGPRYLAECVELPLGRESDTLDGAIRDIEDAIRRYLRAKTGEDPTFHLLVSLHFGRSTLTGL